MLAGQICAVNGSRCSLPGVGFELQLHVEKDKDRVIAHCGTQEVRGMIHTCTVVHCTRSGGFFLTINAIAWAISPTKNCLKRLLMQSGCNCQKFRAGASGREMSISGSFASAVSRAKSEEVDEAQRGQTLARLTTTKRCPWPPPWTALPDLKKPPGQQHRVSTPSRPD